MLTNKNLQKDGDLLRRYLNYLKEKESLTKLLDNSSMARTKTRQTRLVQLETKLIPSLLKLFSGERERNE